MLPVIIAHRGASGYAPENTLAAMNLAHELGIQWVEFDVQLSKDEKLIIMHDETVDRTTTGRGTVESLNSEVLFGLDAGSWFSNEFKGERVLTLSELLMALKTWQLNPVIELKSDLKHALRLAQGVLEALKKDWLVHRYSFLISSQDWSCLEAIRSMSSDVRLGVVMDNWSDDCFEPLKNLNCHSAHLNHVHLTSEIVKKVKQHGYEVFAYTVNDKQRADELISWGVDALFSDFPDKII